MKERCYKPYNVSYKNYGAKGIKICKRWHKFENFWEDMRDTYADDLTIDRINSKGDYKPSNCRWATWKVQNNNSSKNRLLTFDGKTMNVTQWSERLGINANTLFSRLDFLGWSVEKTLQTPPTMLHKRKSKTTSQIALRINKNSTTH